MTFEATGETIFCDDIRQEVNGKVTLVGCYANIINFASPAPAVLPTFAAYVMLSLPNSFNVRKVEIIVKIDYGDEVQELVKVQSEPQQEELDQARSEFGDNPDAVIRVTAPLQWVMINIKNDCLIKVRALLNDEQTVKLGALKVVFPREVS